MPAYTIWRGRLQPVHVVLIVLLLLICAGEAKEQGQKKEKKKSFKSRINIFSDKSPKKTEAPKIIIPQVPTPAPFVQCSGDRYIAVVEDQAFYLSTGTSNSQAWPLTWFPFCGFGPSTAWPWDVRPKCDGNVEDLYKCTQDMPQRDGKYMKRQDYWTAECATLCQDHAAELDVCGDATLGKYTKCIQHIGGHFTDVAQLLKASRLPVLQPASGPDPSRMWRQLFEHYRTHHPAEVKPQLQPWVGDVAAGEAWLRTEYTTRVAQEKREPLPHALPFPDNNNWIDAQGGRVPGWARMRPMCAQKQSI